MSEAAAPSTTKQAEGASFGGMSDGPSPRDSGPGSSGTAKPLERSSDVLGLVWACLRPGLRATCDSALVGLLCWLLRLAISPGKPDLQTGHILILLLNLRGRGCWHEGPALFSHCVYIVVITAFRGWPVWRPLGALQASLVAIAVAAVDRFCSSHLTLERSSLQANLGRAQADLPGLSRPVLGGQYFRVGSP